MGRDKFFREAGKVLGKGVPKLAEREAGRRLLGRLLRKPEEWDRAFRYVAKHFNKKALKDGRTAHGVFAKKYRESAKLKELVSDAAANPSRAPFVSRATRPKQGAVGEFRVVVERDFGKEIGREVIEDTPCSILRIITDFKGKIISIHPVSSYLEGGKVTLLAAALFAAMDEAFAEEEKALHRFLAPCPDDWTGFVLPILMDASCSAAPEIPKRQDVDRRAEQAIGRIEREVGSALSPADRADVRRQVDEIWYPNAFPPREDDDPLE